MTGDLPLFPRFEPLEARHQAAINDFVRAFDPYSDYNFISLWSWDHQDKLRFSSLNDNLVIRFQDYTDADDFFYSFLGSSQTDATAQTLLSHSSTEGALKLKLIPESVVKSLARPHDFVIAEDRDGFDYIIATKPENGHSKKRELHRFLKEHGDKLRVSELDIKNPRHAEAILKVTEKWAAGVTDDRFNANEIAAIKKIISEHHRIDTDNLHVVGLYMGGELSAFCIAEVIGDGFAMGHYAKTDKRYRRIGAALDHFVADSLAGKGVKYFNQEQDLGLEGLRASKMSKQPVFFLKKYTIGLK